MTQHRRWGATGLAALTGRIDGPPDFSRAPLLDLLDDTWHTFLTSLQTLGAQPPALVDLDPAHLLGGRAAFTGHSRNGHISAGGATRLLRCAQDWVALTLSRDSDVELVPALLGTPVTDRGDELWQQISDHLAASPADEVLQRARLLGLPMSRLGEVCPDGPRVIERGAPAPVRTLAELLVVDLSPLWAGPLCSTLLGLGGATVVKVESPARPDGARSGDRGFFDWVNSGKLSFSVNFTRARTALAELLSVADVVIEGSRPGALRRLGLDEASVPARTGQVWARISAYGVPADETISARVGFGDDTAVAGGLVGADDEGLPVFCADAVADPLTGIEAASAVTAALVAGGGALIDISLAHTAARHAAAGTSAPPRDAVLPAPAPPMPVDWGRAPELGADNAEVERIVAQRR